MKRPWSAEVVVTAEMAVELVETQFPELAPASVEPLGEGWDNMAFLVNGEYVFRFPRRTIGARLMVSERRILPQLVSLLPLPVPAPRFFGVPSEHFRWRFSGYSLLAGRSACDADLDEAARSAAARPIADFLAVLHGVRPDAIGITGDAEDPFARFDLKTRIPRIEQRLGELRQAGLLDDVRRCIRVIEETPTASISDRRVIVHGDLSADHLLFDNAGRICGIIDWGDVHVGQPALDLSIAHGFLPPSAHEPFLRTYGHIDDGTWRLARFHALDHTIASLLYAHETSRSELARESLIALRILTGS